MDLFAKWGTKHAALFTFAHSAKHVCLYQKFGFWPRYLTAIMSQTISPGSTSPASTFSELDTSEHQECLAVCRELTDALYEGLDVSSEICAVAGQRLGDTVLIWDDATLAGFAICHCGPGTDGCKALAAGRGLLRIEAGVNLARRDAYKRMRARGFRTDIQGVAMHKPDEPGYSRDGVYVIDDWR
jgi:hypothetical protein